MKRQRVLTIAFIVLSLLVVGLFYLLKKDAPPLDRTLCNQAYEPVCGNDGNTYSNSCIANQNKIFTFTVGICEPKD